MFLLPSRQSRSSVPDPLRRTRRLEFNSSAMLRLPSSQPEVQRSSSVPEDSKARVKLFGHVSFVGLVNTQLPTPSCSFELFDSDCVQSLDRNGRKRKTKMPRERKGSGDNFLIGEFN